MSRKKADTTTRIKGKGWFVNPDSNVIYVQGSVGGKFYRKSTGMAHNSRNEKYITRHHRDVLLNIIHKPKVVQSDFAAFGREVIESGAKREGIIGGRDELSQRDALSKWERLILPEFAGFAIEEIRVSHIERWQSKLIGNYSSSTVSKCRVLLSQIMHKACANDIIVKNPVEYAERIQLHHAKQLAYSIEDAKRLMRESTGWMHSYLNLAFTTGMRTGELMALRWEDIDYDNSCIFLQRSISKGRIKLGTAGKKNHSRIVPLLPQVLEILRAGKARSHSPWMFPSRSGEPYAESKSITKHHFKPLLKRLGIEYITLYATRHTFSTIAENAMVAEGVLTEMMGNSAQVRKDHYTTYAMTSQRRDAAMQELSPVNSIFFDKQAAVN